MPSTTTPGDGTDHAPPGDPGDLQIDMESLARDWITLWQSEIAALAADPETAETTARVAAIWAAAANAMLRPMPGAAPAQAPAHDQKLDTGAAAAPGAAPAAAAPDAGADALLGVLGRLDERIGAIERRLAALESNRLRHAHGAPHGRPGGSKPGRRRPG